MRWPREERRGGPRKVSGLGSCREGVGGGRALHQFTAGSSADHGLIVVLAGIIDPVGRRGLPSWR